MRVAVSFSMRVMVLVVVVYFAIADDRIDYLEYSVLIIQCTEVN